ncbi:cytochrome P450 [Aspergillus stella-maris]|uniref:cytochrome P450 n=1 Tax=Aspergillus stella-maris TaxID=1810926 RepID=UPI003CCCB66D
MVYPLRNDKRLDFRTVADFHMFAPYTDSYQPPQFVKSIHIDLNKRLSTIVPLLAEEIRAGLAAELDTATDTAQGSLCRNPKDLTLKLTARAVSRIAVGATHIKSSNEWLESLIQYPTDVFGAGIKLLRWPSFLRPIAKLFIPEFQRLRHVRRLVRAQLAPVYAQARRDQRATGESVPKCLDDDTLMSWVWRNSREQDRTDAYQSQAVLFLTLPALYTTALGVAQALIDLAAYPQYLPMIRDEFGKGLSEGNGVLSRAALDNMVKMDSFIKESQRINPLTLVSFERKTKDAVALGDGTKLPKGAYVAAPAYHIGMDPSHHSSPDEFDGLRFWKLREQASTTGETPDIDPFRYDTASETHLHFGLGRHACPGRFVAGIWTKLVLGFVAMNYDVSVPGSEGKRPSSVIINTFFEIPPSSQISLRSRVA